MSTLDQDIKDSIAKNLPAQVGDVLRERLEKANQDAVRLADTLKRLDELRNTHDTLQRKHDAALQDLTKHTTLEQREAAVRESERDLRVKVAETELNAERRISNTLIDVLGKLVRNTEYRSRVFGNENIPVPGSAQCVGYAANVPVDRTTTSSQE